MMTPCRICGTDLSRFDIEYHYSKNHLATPDADDYIGGYRDARKVIGELRQRVEELEQENARLRAEIGEAGSPPPLGSGRQRAIAAEAKLAELQRSYDFMSGEAYKREQAEAQLAKVVEIAEDGQSRDALHAFDALLRISRIAAAKGE